VWTNDSLNAAWRYEFEGVDEGDAADCEDDDGDAQCDELSLKGVGPLPACFGTPVCACIVVAEAVGSVGFVPAAGGISTTLTGVSEDELRKVVDMLAALCDGSKQTSSSMDSNRVWYYFWKPCLLREAIWGRVVLAVNRSAIATPLGISSANWRTKSPFT
jgi:hypothetical protein